MKKLIFAKFLIDITKFFFVVSLSLGLIVWVIQSVNYLDLIIEDGHNFNVYFSFSLFNFPKILHRILPFVFFISLFYQILEYEKHNELIIFWANGISKTQFVNVLIIFSILVSFFQIFLGSFVSPLGQYKARFILKDSNIDFFPSLIKEGKFIDAVSDLTIFIESKTEDGNYKNIFLKADEINSMYYKDLSANKREKYADDDFLIKSFKIIYAKKGFLVNNKNEKILRLENGKMINQDKDTSDIFEFDEIDFDLSDYGTKTVTFPKIQETSSVILARCIIFDYKNKIKSFEEKYFNCEKSTLNVVKQELLKRLYLPVYLPLLALICGTLLFRSKESSNYNRFKFFLFILGFLTLVFSEISLRYSTMNIFSFALFIIIPITIFLILYSVFTQKNKI